MVQPQHVHHGPHDGGQEIVQLTTGYHVTTLNATNEAFDDTDDLLTEFVIVVDTF